MVDDLANVNRNITPWVELNGHRPIYTTSSSGGSLSSVTTVAKDLRASIEDILYQYEVPPSPMHLTLLRPALDSVLTSGLDLRPGTACASGAI